MQTLHKGKRASLQVWKRNSSRNRRHRRQPRKDRRGNFRNENPLDRKRKGAGILFVYRRAFEQRGEYKRGFLRTKCNTTRRLLRLTAQTVIK